MEEQLPIVVWSKQQQPFQVHLNNAQIATLGQQSFNINPQTAAVLQTVQKETYQFCEKEADQCTAGLSNSKKSFYCITCGKTFSSQRNLLVHNRSHTGNRPYKCEECGKTFTQKNLLVVHSRIHTGERPYECGVCGKKFYQSDHLKKHSRIHTGIKPYMCKECGKAYSDNSSLKYHMKKHTDVQPYICEYCHESFDKKSKYNLHLMMHKGIKPEECEVCNKKFPSKSLLVSHKRCHFTLKNVTCSLCDKEFTRAVTLKKHLKYYHGYKSEKIIPNYDRQPRKPYGENKSISCSLCDMTFSNNSKYLAHQLTHQSDKQFKCDKCDMLFAKSFTLQFHKQMHLSESGSEEGGLLKIVPVQSYLSKVKSDIMNDPLAQATAAAQVTPDLVENLNLYDQPSFTYFIQSPTIPIQSPILHMNQSLQRKGETSAVVPN